MCLSSYTRVNGFEKELTGTPVDFDVFCVTIDDRAMTGHDRVREIAGLENEVALLKMQLEKTEAQLDTAANSRTRRAIIANTRPRPKSAP